MSILSVLSVLLKADGAQFTSEMRGARKESDVFIRSIESMKSALNVLKTNAYVELARSGLEAFDKIGESIKQQAEGIHAVELRAKRLGVTYESLSALQRAAGREGVSTDQITAGLDRMSIFLGKAHQGSEEAIGTLGRLKLQVEQFAGLAPDEAFLKMAGALAKVDDGYERAALVQAVFGKGAQELGNLLSVSAEQVDEFKKGLSLSPGQREMIVDTMKAVNLARAKSDLAAEQLGAALAGPTIAYHEAKANAYQTAGEFAQEYLGPGGRPTEDADTARRRADKSHEAIRQNYIEENLMPAARAQAAAGNGPIAQFLGQNRVAERFDAAYARMNADRARPLKEGLENILNLHGDRRMGKHVGAAGAMLDDAGHSIGNVWSRLGDAWDATPVDRMTLGSGEQNVAQLGGMFGNFIGGGAGAIAGGVVGQGPVSAVPPEMRASALIQSGTQADYQADVRRKVGNVNDKRDEERRQQATQAVSLLTRAVKALESLTSK